MTEAMALEFQAPSGEPLRFEWRAERLAAFEPGLAGGEPVWQLGGELDWDEIAAVRVISARLDDGRLIAIVALKPSEARGHGEEVVAGAIGDAEAFAQLEETLVSTEYGPDGLPRRIGLELYPSADAIPLRVAGEAISTQTAEDGGLRRTSSEFTLRAAGGCGALSLDLLAPG